MCCELGNRLKKRERRKEIRKGVGISWQKSESERIPGTSDGADDETAVTKSEEEEMMMVMAGHTTAVQAVDSIAFPFSPSPFCPRTHARRDDSHIMRSSGQQPSV